MAEEPPAEQTGLSRGSGFRSAAQQIDLPELLQREEQYGERNDRHENTGNDDRVLRRVATRDDHEAVKSERERIELVVDVVPALTTVRVPLVEVGREAIARLIGAASGQRSRVVVATVASVTRRLASISRQVSGWRHTGAMTAAMSAKQALRMRLSSQLIEPSSAHELDVPGVVGHLLAIQAQDFGQALWAIGLRLPKSTKADVLGALERGEVVRSSPLRGTLFFVAAEDLRWMLRITAPRTIASAVTRHRQLGLDEGVLGRARELAIAELTGGNAITRDRFFAALERAGISTTGQRGYHIIWHLAQTAVICWGPPAGTQQALVLVDEWIPVSRDLEREQALREFALRYFSGHGPATLRDLAWWAKLTLADARLGLELARADLTEVSLDGVPHWVAADGTEAAVMGGESVHALPGFDEYVLGYQDRSLAIAGEHSNLIVPGNNGVFLPTIVSRGRVVGTWRRTSAASGITVRPEPFGILNKGQTAGFERAANAYRAFFAR